MFVDFHTHLHGYDDGVIDEVVEEIDAKAILAIACSMDVESYRKTKTLATLSELIVPTFGIHPARAGAPFDAAELDRYLADSPVVGEIGLDFHWVTDVPVERQERVLEKFLDHCHRERKYCVLHTKGAEERVLDILAGFAGAKPIVHWYSGEARTFKRYVDRGYWFTFGCEVAYSEDIRRLARMVPADRLLAETDNPDAERWLGGTEDRPGLIERVVRDIAAARSVDEAAMADTLVANGLFVLRESGITIPRSK